MAANRGSVAVRRRRGRGAQIGGGGVFWHRAAGLGPTGTLVFTSSSPTAAGGLGPRVRLAERWTLAPEARMGFEPLFQVTASLGYSF